jgi:diguanylate cyclase (GGDEF)-like protein
MPDTRLQDPALVRLLAVVSERFELGKWMVTRREGDDLTVVAALGDGLPVAPGDRTPWERSVCCRMARGEGPRAAPKVADVPAYATARAARGLALGAYVGVPIESPDGALGTICGIDLHPQHEDLDAAVPVLEAWAELVGRLWRAEREARTDLLTGLPNRRAWEEALGREEERCRRFGRAAAVLAVDLDDFKTVNDRFGYAAGDAHLQRAAATISAAVRDHDLVARWGGDEFCVLAAECGAADAERLAQRVRSALSEAALPASVGVAPNGPEGLAATVGRAFAGVGTEK